jgi:ribosomal protein S18 acetylase RimI-like enzyme
MTDKIEIIVGDIRNKEHQQAMLSQLDLYMQDPMGGHGAMSDELASDLISGLMNQPNFVFFLAKCNDDYAGFANCFVNFSTFKAKQLINIHDFAVSPQFRKKGIGKELMNAIFNYSRNNHFCKVTLEVRHDNPNAQNLYKSLGFSECNPPMFFWDYVF